MEKSRLRRSVVKRVPFDRNGELPHYVGLYQLEESGGGSDYGWHAPTRQSYRIPWTWADNVPQEDTFVVVNICASRSAAEVWLEDVLTHRQYPMRGTNFTQLLHDIGYFGPTRFRYDFEKCGTRYFMRYLGRPKLPKEED